MNFLTNVNMTSSFDGKEHQLANILDEKYTLVNKSIKIICAFKSAAIFGNFLVLFVCWENFSSFYRGN